MLLMSVTLFANNGENPLIELNLCSGQTMTWEEYLEMRECNAEDYEMEKASNASKFSAEEALVNNTSGAWSNIINMPIIPVAVAHMPNGKLMTWSAKDRFAFGGNLGRTYTAIFDPATNSSEEILIEHTSHDMFCPGTNMLPDGRILVTGGSSSNKTSTYDPFTGQWSAAAEMNIPRGYHSNVTLASGATFLIGGSWSGGVGGKDAEIWSEKTGWFRLPGVTVDVITLGINSSQPVQHDDYFPWLWVAPNGKLFHAGPSPQMHWIDPEGVGSFTGAGIRGNDNYSINGSTVMYDIGKLLKTGGAGTFENQSPANDNTYIIDINGNNAITTQVGDLNFARNYFNTVVLPSGEVLVIGGIPTSHAFSDTDSRYIPELWSPITQSWTQMAAMQVPRNYHSVAILMTDGRVFSGGGGLCNTCSTNHPDAEIFSPPYLFNSNGTLATRPVINNAPTTVDYNSTIQVSTNTNINSFVFVRMSSGTHSTNNEQRRIPLVKTNLGNNQYQLAVPGRNLLPPGMYMLFAMNNNGTPGIAKVIKLGDDINDCTPQSEPDLGGTGLTGQYFNNSNFTNLILERLDATVNFNWGINVPVSGVGADTYSVRWEGGIEVPRSGTYTFYTNSDDGVRLWINNKLMVDNWTDHSVTEDVGMIHLEPGQRYEITLEYYENTGEALMELRWSGPGINKKIIPAKYLFPMSECLVNEPCDDNDFCTSNDVYDIDCNCAGVFQDSDGDGICDTNDSCPNLNNNLIGTSCDDGSSSTINDVYQSDCTCSGVPDNGGGDPNCDDVNIIVGTGTITVEGMDGAPVVALKIMDANWQMIYQCFQSCNAPTEVISVTAGLYRIYVDYYTADYVPVCQVQENYNIGGNGCTDNDNDGVCAADDCDDSNAAIPTTVGTTCDDGNPNTINDVILNDGCTCAGTPDSGNGNCNNVVITTGNGTITVSGMDGAPITALRIFDTNWETIYQCFQVCAIPIESHAVADGLYHVFVDYYSTNYVLLCSVAQDVTVGGTGCTDNDGDGICVNQDCNDNNPNIPTTVGTSCDDGDPNTINDVIQSDGCTCIGTPDTGDGNCNVIYTIGTDNITISGLTSGHVIIQVFDSNWSFVFNCLDNCNTPVELVDNLSPGTYYVKTALYDASWNPICEVNEFESVGTLLEANAFPEVLFFNVVKNNGQANLNWVVNTEYKTDQFVVQRSANGFDFYDLFEIAPMSNSHLNVVYQEQDEMPLPGTNFYRIKQILEGGSTRYSVTKVLKFDFDADHFRVFPNPSSGKLNVDISALEATEVEVVLYNLYGVALIKKQYNSDHANMLELDLSTFENGMYQILIKGKDQRAVTKKVLLMRNY